jgi:hypothetical protein
MESVLKGNEYPAALAAASRHFSTPGGSRTWYSAIGRNWVDERIGIDES